MTLPGPALMFVEPSVSTDALTLSEIDGRPPREATVIVGPEGGWSIGELDRGSAVCRFVTLGASTLRADAMPLVALAALFAVWREF
jgi:16S rRNA U1498 N3-methylase RsmE